MTDSSRILSLLSIRPDWLNQCRQHLEQSSQLRGTASIEQAIFSIYCHTDIISTCSQSKIIPHNIESMHKQFVFSTKPVILQIDKIENISDRIDTTKDDAIGVPLVGKCNKLTLSDGHRHCFAFDFQGLLQAYEQRSFPIQPGSKIVLKNLLVRRGALILQDQNNNVCFLGGNVAHDGQSQILRELLGYPTIVATTATKDAATASTATTTAATADPVAATNKSTSISSNNNSNNNRNNNSNSNTTIGTVPSSTNINNTNNIATNQNTVNFSSNIGSNMRSTVSYAASSVPKIPPTSINTGSNNNSNNPITTTSTTKMRANETISLLSQPSYDEGFDHNINEEDLYEAMAMDIEDFEATSNKPSTNNYQPQTTNTTAKTAVSSYNKDNYNTNNSNTAHTANVGSVANTNQHINQFENNNKNYSTTRTSNSASGNNHHRTMITNNNTVLMTTLKSVFSSNPHQANHRSPLVAHIRGFASRVYRCKLHKLNNAGNNNNDNNNTSTPYTQSAASPTSTVVLTRAFLRSYLTQTSLNMNIFDSTTDTFYIATSQIRLEVIIDFHDGVQQVPVLVHPHLSCRFLALLLCFNTNSTGNSSSVIDEDVPVTMEEILSCFQQFQGIFLTSPYPLSTSEMARSGDDHMKAMVNAYQEGLAEELRGHCDRFRRKFYATSNTNAANTSYSQTQSQSNTTTGSSTVNTNGSSAGSPNHTSTNANNSSNAKHMLVLLDFASPIDAKQMPASVQKRYRLQQQQQQQQQQRVNDSNTDAVKINSTVIELIHQKMTKY